MKLLEVGQRVNGTRTIKSEERKIQINVQEDRARISQKISHHIFLTHENNRTGNSISLKNYLNEAFP